MRILSRIIFATTPVWLLAIAPSLFAQNGGSFIPPGSGGLIGNNPFGNQSNNQTGNTVLLQQIQMQQQQMLGQQRVQQFLSNNARVSTTGHPVLFNDTGRYFGEGTNGGGSISPTPPTPFFDRNTRPGIFQRGSGLNFVIGIP